jgi:hypothetical protein
MLVKNKRNNNVEIKLTRKRRISNVEKECYRRGVEGVVSRKSKKNNIVKKECCQGRVGGGMSKKKATYMRSVINIK